MNFDIEENNVIDVLEFPEIISTQWMFENFQAELDDLFLSKNNEIEINFSRTEYIDIGAISIMALNFKKLNKSFSKKITIRVSESINKVLSRSGFISVFESLVGCKIELVESTINCITNFEVIYPVEVRVLNEDFSISNFNRDSDFDEADIILPTRGIEDYVDNIINILEININTDFNAFVWNRTRLKIVIFELVENIYKHSRANYGAICIAIKKGNLNYNDNIDTQKKVKQSNKYEMDYNAKFVGNVLNEKELFFDVIVTDDGIGLQKFQFRSKYGLREFARHAFIEDRQYTFDMTRYGGLNVIGQVLSESKDFLLCSIGRELCTFSFPFRGDEVKTLSFYKLAFSTKEDGNQNNLPGIYWNAKISMDKKGEIFTNKYFYNKNTLEMVKELRIKRINYNEIIKHFIIFDKRDFGNLKNQQIIKSNKLILLFPPTTITKNQINKLYREIVKKLKEDGMENCLDKLVIADVNLADLLSFHNAFDEMKIADGEIYFLEMVISTINMQIGYFVFDKKRGRYVYEENRSRNYSAHVNETKIFFENDSAFANDIYGLIRHYDSQLFDSNLVELSKNTDGVIFVNDDIHWTSLNTTKNVHGYLNFHETLVSKNIIRLYERGLERIVGIYKSNVYFKSIDIITRRLVEDINAKIYIDEKSTKINVGSVYLSGATEKMNSINGDIIYFFTHKDSENAENEENAVSAIFNWPKSIYQVESINKKKYKRLGRTYTITDEENYFIDKLRLSKRSSCVGSLKAFYEMFHTKYPSFISLGHYRYDMHDDFFGINVIDWFKHELLLNGDMAYYIISITILRLEVGIIDRLEKNNNMWSNLKRWQSERNMSNLSDVGLILYPSHSINDLIVDILKNTVIDKCKLLKDYDKKFISIPIVDEYRNRPLKIDILTREKLEKLAEKHKKVILFDSTIITGTTVNGLKKKLKEIGFESIEIVTIVNRSRESNQVSSYINLELPVLDEKKECKICKSIEIIDNIIGSIDINSEMQSATIDRLKQWKKRWECSYIRSGISNLSKIVFDSPIDLICGNDTVKIYDSESLCIILSEILASTFDNDIVLNIIKDYQNTVNSKVIILICSIQLLLFGDELPLSLKCDLYEKIVYALSTMCEVDEYSMLGSVVLLAQNNYEVKRSIEKYKLVRNIDARIIEMYFNNKIYKREDYYKSVLTDYSYMHSQLFTVQGVQHDAPLFQLVEKGISMSFEQYKIQLSRIIDELISLKQLIERIPCSLLRVDINNTTIASELARLIYDEHAKLNEFLILILNDFDNDEKNEPVQKEDVKKKINEFLPIVKQYYNLFSLDIGFLTKFIGIQNEIEKICKEVVKDWKNVVATKMNVEGIDIIPQFTFKVNSFYPANFNNEYAFLFIIWDKHMYECIKFFIQNSCHAKANNGEKFVGITFTLTEKLKLSIDIENEVSAEFDKPTLLDSVLLKLKQNIFYKVLIDEEKINIDYDFIKRNERNILMLKIEISVLVNRGGNNEISDANN